MKKIIASFAVVVYLIFACGVMVNYHYCMDRYDSFRLYKTASDWCGRCGMHTKDHGCCHDDVKIVKLQDDHQASSISFELKNIQPAVAAFSNFLTVIIQNEDVVLNKTDHSPPLLSLQDLYIRNRVFRI